MFPINEHHVSEIENFILSQHTKYNPIVVGIQGVQGCGKSHTCSDLKRRLETKKFTVAILSLDDFYLDRNRMGSHTIRGHPGTHDFIYLGHVIESMKTGQACRIPRYDSTQWEGKGDRVGYSIYDQQPDIILVEGWCIGFYPSGRVETAVNDYVRQYHMHISTKLNIFVILVADPINSYRWRARAEQLAITDGKTGMSDDEIRDFISHYMPVYNLYLLN